MTHSTQQTPLLLGIAERAAYVRDGLTNLGKWNVLGLRRIVLTNVLPATFPDWYLAIAFPDSSIVGEHKFTLVHQTGAELGFVNVSLSNEPPPATTEAPDPRGLPVIAPPNGYSLLFLPLRNTNITIPSPGEVHLRLGSATGPSIGSLSFLVADPPPLDIARVNAIRSDPAAAKAVRLEYRCSSCGDSIRVYTALEHLAKLESDGWIWYSDLPQEFACKCGRTRMPLDIVRRNLHGLLGQPTGSGGELSFTPLYEAAALADLRHTFSSTLSRSPREEDLQILIQSNPVLLHQFPAVRIFNKPPILTEFFADFGILTPQKELLLVEIEKPNTRLLKKDGGVAADLSHAFDQVRSWLHLVDEHRLAALSQLKLENADVSSVRGVVIAGRDTGYDALHLRRLKGQDWGRISLFTYDDILFALDSLTKRMSMV